MPGSWLPREFPNLKETDYDQTSVATSDYNCIAWAVHDSTQRWDPDEMEQFYWPEGVPREIEVEAFVQAFRTKGFQLCDDAALEDGLEKIAIYTTSDGKPTHAARQLVNGNWTSKLGDCEDVEHKTLDCLNGEELDLFGRTMYYGKPTLYMKRPRP